MYIDKKVAKAAYDNDAKMCEVMDAACEEIEDLYDQWNNEASAKKQAQEKEKKISEARSALGGAIDAYLDALGVELSDKDHSDFFKKLKDAERVAQFYQNGDGIDAFAEFAANKIINLLFGGDN